MVIESQDSQRIKIYLFYNCSFGDTALAVPAIKRRENA